MEDDLPIGRGLIIPGRELTMTASRSGGPGGQNVNKVSTRVTLRYDLRGSEVFDERQKTRIAERLGTRINNQGEIVLHADEHRSQPRNRDAARVRLAALLQAALKRNPRRIRTKPTAGSIKRRLENKKRRAQIKKARGKPPTDD